jgi:hypothetical protein
MSNTKKIDKPKDEEAKFAFGFAVLVDPAGGVFIERNPKVFTIETEREASLLEVRRYTSEILMDLQAQSAAEYVALRMGLLNQPEVKTESEPPKPTE